LTEREPATRPSTTAADRAGREVEWEVIYRQHVTSIYRMIYAKVGNQADAEDLTSEVFLHALPHLRVATSGGQVHQYLVVTARSVLANHWRRHYGVVLTVLDDDVAPPVSPVGVVEDDADDKEMAVASILTQLPDNYRRVLRLRFLEGASVKGTAAAMGISVNNAKVVQHRALQQAAKLGLGRGG
jgi:RNA polymerase sigma factor (sigma-70 family)